MKRLVFCLLWILILCGLASGQGDQVASTDTVHFVNGEYADSGGWGGGVKRSVWQANPTYTLYMTTTGKYINDPGATAASACTVEDNGGGILRVTGGSSDWFTNVVVGTIAYVDFAASYASGYFFILAIDPGGDWVDLEGTTYVSDTYCVIWVGGAFGTMDGAMSSDSTSAASDYKIIMVAGDETDATTNDYSAGEAGDNYRKIIKGVKSDWSDFSLTDNLDDFPLLTCSATSSAAAGWKWSQQNVTLAFLRFAAPNITTYDTVRTQGTDGNCAIIRCRITAPDGSARGGGVYSGGLVYGSHFVCNANTDIGMHVRSGVAIGNVIEGAGGDGDGVLAGSASEAVTMIGNIIVAAAGGSTGDGIDHRANAADILSAVFYRNTVDGFANGYGRETSSSAGDGISLCDNLFMNCTAGIHAPSTHPGFYVVVNNGFYNCSTQTDIPAEFVFNSRTLTANPCRNGSHISARSLRGTLGYRFYGDMLNKSFGSIGATEPQSFIPYRARYNPEVLRRD